MRREYSSPCYHAVRIQGATTSWLSFASALSCSKQSGWLSWQTWINRFLGWWLRKPDTCTPSGGKEFRNLSWGLPVLPKISWYIVLMLHSFSKYKADSKPRKPLFQYCSQFWAPAIQDRLWLTGWISVEVPRDGREEAQTLWGEARRDGLAQPGAEVTSEGPDSTPPVPVVRSRMRQSRAAHRGAGQGRQRQQS